MKRSRTQKLAIDSLCMLYVKPKNADEAATNIADASRMLTSALSGLFLQTVDSKESYDAAMSTTKAVCAEVEGLTKEALRMVMHIQNIKINLSVNEQTNLDILKELENEK